MSDTPPLELVKEDFLPLLDKASFLGNNKIRVERVNVPELGGSVLVKEMTAGERDNFEASLVMRDPKGKRQEMTTENIRAKFVQKVTVNADHSPMFSEGEVLELTKVSAAAMDRIYKVGSRLSGLTDEDVEELAKNSNSAQPDEH